MRRARFLLLLFVCSGCAGTYGPVSSVRVERSGKGHYLVVDTATGRGIPEGEFARLYKARTGSTELDATDHAHVTITVVGGSIAATMLAGSALVGALGIPNCDEQRSQCTAATYLTVVLGLVGSLLGAAIVRNAIRGSPEEHDVPRDRAMQLVDAYNRTPPIGPPEP